MIDVDLLSRLAVALRASGVSSFELGSGEGRVAMNLHPPEQMLQPPEQVTSAIEDEETRARRRADMLDLLIMSAE